MHGISTALLISLRSLTRKPGLVLGVACCLGLGLGVNVAMFSILSALLWGNPSGVTEPESVLRVYATRVYPGAGPITSDVFSYPAFGDLRDAATARVAAYSGAEVIVGGGTTARKLRAELVSSSYFPLLGLRPSLGRYFSDDEAQMSSGARVVVLSHRLWHGRFGGDPAILGRAIPIQGRFHRVVGVAPAGFFGVDNRPADLWLPMAALPIVLGEGLEKSRGSQILHMLLRIGSEGPRDWLADELTGRYRAVHEAEAPGSPDAGAQLSLWPLLATQGPHPPPEVRVATWTSALAFLLLLISIANVANLLIVRGLGRRQESALRLALGAARRALVRDVLAEGFLLTLAGGVLAVPVCLAILQLVPRFLLAELPQGVRLLNLSVLAFGALLGLGTALGCALIAALPLRSFQVASALRSGASGRVTHQGLRNGLLVSQVALAAVLLVGAGLFLRSLANVHGLDLGLETDRLAVVTVEGEDRSTLATERLLQDARGRVEALPGVEAAAIVATPPFGTSYGTSIAVPGRDELPTLPTGGPYLSVVEPSYFDVGGLQVVEGRGFLPESRDPSVVVNTTLAELLWGDAGALDQCLVVDDPDTSPCSRVVGVVEDARRLRLVEPPTMQLYVPLEQGPDWISDRTLVVRTSGRPADLVEVIRKEVLAAEPGLRYVDVQPVAEKLHVQYSSWRLGANVFSLFALLAAGLTLAGVYGVTAYLVTQRRREIGIRLALGAAPQDVKLLLSRQGLRLTSLGILLGLAGSGLLGRAFQDQLFEVSPWDPLTLLLVGLALLTSSLGASWWSAWRIRSVDPVEVMTSE